MQIRRIPVSESEKKTLLAKMTKAAQNAATTRFNVVHKNEEVTTDVAKCFNKWETVKAEFDAGFVAWNLARDADDMGKLYLRHLSVCCTRKDRIPGQGGTVVATRTINGIVHQIKRYTVTPLQSLDPARPMSNPPPNPAWTIDVFRLHDPVSKFVTLRMGTPAAISMDIQNAMFNELKWSLNRKENKAAKAQA